MKKLFIPLLITMTGLAVNSALAQSTATITKPKSSGFVTVNGQTGTELDAATAKSYPSHSRQSRLSYSPSPP